MDHPTRKWHISHILHVLLNTNFPYCGKLLFKRTVRAQLSNDGRCHEYRFSLYILHLYTTIHCVRAVKDLAGLRECTGSSELSQFANAAISNAGSLIKSCHAKWCFSVPSLSSRISIIVTFSANSK